MVGVFVPGCAVDLALLGKSVGASEGMAVGTSVGVLVGTAVGVIVALLTRSGLCVGVIVGTDEGD
jgi:branched-subunit amino acid transport protein